MKQLTFQPQSVVDEMRGIFCDDQIQPLQKSNSQIEPVSIHSILASPSDTNYKIKLYNVHSTQNQTHSNQMGLSGKWKTQSLLIISMVIRFVYQLKTRIDSTKLKMITRRIYSVINDVASDYLVLDNNRRNKKQKHQPAGISLYVATLVWHCSKLFKFIDNQIPILMTNSPILIMFQFIMLLALTINIFYVPLNLGLLGDEDNLYFQMIPHIIFAFFIIVSCNTAVYQDEVLQTKRDKIVVHYCKHELIRDIMIILPYYFKPYLYNYSEFTFFLKILQLKSILEQFEYNNNFKEKLAATIDLMKLFIFLIFITHCCACGWHFLGVYQIETLNQEHSWLIYYQYYGKVWSDRYVASLYWSVVTTLTVGYGDITPQTKLEQLYVIIVAMVVCGLLGYTVTSIGEIFKSLNERKMIYKHQMKAVDQLVKQRGLNTQLQIKVRKYFQHLFIKEQEENSLGEQLLTKLTRNLEEEVLIDTYYRVLKQSVLLKHFKDRTIEKLCTKVQVAQYGPGNDVIKCQTQADSIIFVMDGNLSVFAPIAKSTISLKCLTAGFVIGEQEFAEHSVYDYSIVSVGYSKIAYITRNDFLEILSIDSEETEKLCQIRDNCLFNSNRRNLVGRVCEICGWTHGYLKCPFVFVELDKWKVVMRHTQNHYQVRQFVRRNRQHKQQSLLMKNRIEVDCIQFFYENRLFENNSLLDQNTITNTDTIPHQSSNHKLSNFTEKQSEDNNDDSSNNVLQPSIKVMDDLKKQQSWQEKFRRTLEQQQDQQFDVPKVNEPIIRNDKRQLSKIIIGQSNQSIDQVKQQLDEILVKLTDIKTTPQITLQQWQEQKEVDNVDEFEVMHNFNNYNPHFNVQAVVTRLNYSQILSSQLKSPDKLSIKKKRSMKFTRIFQQPNTINQ